MTAEKIIIYPHPNADALELAEVGLYQAVVAKGAYQTGDWAVYIPEQAVLPDPLISELNLTGRLAGPDHNRVKAIRLRGRLSQGIVCRPEALKDVDLADAAANGVDFAERLGVVKWKPTIPDYLAGEAYGAPDLLRWPDLQNIKRHPEVFMPGEAVHVSEKIHGVCMLVTYRHEPTSREVVHVTSKGLGEQYLALKESTTNLYWRAVISHRLIDVARAIAREIGSDHIGLFGEVYGMGVQDLGYQTPTATPGFVLFDVRASTGHGLMWLAPDILADVLDTLDQRGDFADIPAPRLAPTLYEGPFDLTTILALADGKETVSGTSAHLREGVVVRSASSRRSEELDGRAILKVVSGAYLTREGGTEYE